MGTAAVFQDRNCLADTSPRLEETDQDDGIGDIGNIQAAGRHRTDKAMLRIDQEGHDALLVQIGQETGGNQTLLDRAGRVSRFNNKFKGFMGG